MTADDVAFAVGLLVVSFVAREEALRHIRLFGGNRVLMFKSLFAPSWDNLYWIVVWLYSIPAVILMLPWKIYKNTKRK